MSVVEAAVISFFALYISKYYYYLVNIFSCREGGSGGKFHFFVVYL